MDSIDVQKSDKTNATIIPSSLLSTVTDDKSFILALILKERTEQEYIKDF